MCGLVFEDLLEQGGLVEVEKKNKKNAEILYNAIDESNGFFRCPVEKSARSLMNVPFTLEKSELDDEFIKEAAKENMVQLKGHKSVGGMRASIYNAMPLAGVEKLVAFMKDFQAKHAVCMHLSCFYSTLTMIILISAKPQLLYDKHIKQQESLPKLDSSIDRGTSFNFKPGHIQGWCSAF
jgi:hypothetical protein